MGSTVDFQDKQKYQEIRPAKLATDISTAALAMYLFWQHALIPGIIVVIVPSVIVTIIIVKGCLLRGIGTWCLDGILIDI